LVDAIAALLVTGIQLELAYATATRHGHSISLLGYVLLAATGMVLVARRRFPVTVLALTYAASVWYWTTTNPQGPIFLADIVAFVTVVLARRRTVAVAALVAYYVGYQWLPVVVGTRKAPSLAVALGAAAGLLILLGAAEWFRLQRQRAAAVALSQKEETRRQASEERLAMARELHDVVAHNISVINVQANTALHLMDRQPERARSALTTINEVSKQALEELRSVLGVLRHVDEEAPLEPSPSLDRLDELIGMAGASGLQVRVENKGQSGLLPASVDLAAYRIVQEALTNAVRHSGGSHAVVHIKRAESSLVIEVDDDGTGQKAESGKGSGNGIVGMTERACALGGSLAVTTSPGGGFRVRAWLPFERLAT
jgi:signal transduction histidine kinase